MGACAGTVTGTSAGAVAVAMPAAAVALVVVVSAADGETPSAPSDAAWQSLACQVAAAERSRAQSPDLQLLTKFCHRREKAEAALTKGRQHWVRQRAWPAAVAAGTLWGAGTRASPRACGAVGPQTLQNPLPTAQERGRRRQTWRAVHHREHSQIGRALSSAGSGPVLKLLERERGWTCGGAGAGPAEGCFFRKGLECSQLEAPQGQLRRGESFLATLYLVYCRMYTMASFLEGRTRSGARAAADYL